MEHCSEVFVGIDVAKARNAIAVADGERGGEVRFVGEVDASEESMRRVVKRIAASCERAHFCYEAGPTGYGLHRLITSLGHSCTVVAPSLIPRKPGDRVKTNRRDAVGLARLLRAGELTAVWVPDEGHEAVRDLVRARAAAGGALRIHRQQVSSFMLKHGRVFERPKAWTMRYLRWLQEQKFDHPAHQIALQEMVEAVRISKERVERLEAAIEEFVPQWSLAPVVQALQALRGVDLIVAVAFVSEIGDLSRFESPRQLMAYPGLVPSERSSGDTARRGSITKAGNGRVRHMLVESAWTAQLEAAITLSSASPTLGEPIGLDTYFSELKVTRQRNRQRTRTRLPPPLEELLRAHIVPTRNVRRLYTALEALNDDASFVSRRPTTSASR